MIYLLSIKNNSGDTPPFEYEDECEARTLHEAAQIFYARLPFEGREEWSPKSLLRHITKDEPEVSLEMIEETRATS
jgi:hypothetical protein